MTRAGQPGPNTLCDCGGPERFEFAFKWHADTAGVLFDELFTLCTPTLVSVWSGGPTLLIQNDGVWKMASLRMMGAWLDTIAAATSSFSISLATVGALMHCFCVVC